MAPLAKCATYEADEDDFMLHYCPHLHEDYDSCPKSYRGRGGLRGEPESTPYYSQRGYGYPVFQGDPYQEGHGIGSLFGSLFRGVAPLLKRAFVPAVKSIAKNVGKSALKHAVGVASDVISGEKDIKTAMQDQAMAGLRDAGNIVKKAVVKRLVSDEIEQPAGRKRRKKPATSRGKKRRKGQQSGGGGAFFTY